MQDILLLLKLCLNSCLPFVGAGLFKNLILGWHTAYRYNVFYWVSIIQILCGYELSLWMKHMYLRGMFKQNRIPPMFQHLSSMLCHLGVVRQAAWETFSLFVDRYGIPFSCGRTRRQRLLLLTDGRKTRRILQVLRRHGEQMRGRQPGEAGRRWREERSKGSTEGRGNEWQWGASAGERCVDRVFSQHLCVSKGKDGSRKPSWGESDFSGEEETLQWHPRLLKKHSFQAFFFYLCNSCHVMQLDVILNSQPRPYTSRAYDRSVRRESWRKSLAK